MTKKFFDILPPKKEEKLPKPPTILPEEKHPLLEGRFKLPKIFEKKLEIWWGVPIFILIFLFLLSFKFLKVEIKIWPETELINFKTKLNIDTKIENPDFKNNLLPGKIFEVEKTVSEEFSATGKALKKAEGVIRLYNSFTTESENWLEGTRFVSADGKLFKSKDKIAVPGASIKNGKISPSFVDVPVIAAEAGSDYDIGPSKFSIVAFRGTPRYTKYYGESFQPMTGGREVSQVKKEDLEMAEKNLTEKAETEAEGVLKEKIPTEFLFSKEILETKILEKTPSAQVGTETEKFNFQIKVKSTTLAFENKDINDFAREFILSQIEKGKLPWEESLKIEYSPETFDFETGKARLSLSLSVKIFPEIDLIALKKGLVGKSLAETKIFLENQPEIIKTEIRFFPFWVKSIPKNLERIEIKYPIID